MHVRRMLVVGMILIVAGPVAAAPEFRVSAVGGNGCGFWGPGFSAVDSRPVLDVQSFFDSIHPATYRYTASSSCGELRLHTEIDWACNCGTLCGENNGLSQLTLDDVVVTGPPGATTANFRINLDLAVPTDTSVGQINWRLYAFAVAFNQALIDTGDHLGTLPTTRFVSSLGSWPVNVPFTLFVRVTTSIHAVDQTPAARGEAIVSFPHDQPLFSFFDSNGQPVQGFSARSAAFTCPRGDMNCDQVVSVADVPQFVLALLQPIGNSLCAAPSADMNSDGFVDGRDVQPFVRCVLNGVCP